MYAILDNVKEAMDKQSSFKKDGEIVAISSRFGEIHADLSKSVYFPKGLMGFPENLHFALVNFPNTRGDLDHFKILQCLNDHSVSMPALPSGFENNFIDAEDMEECIKAVEVKKENFAMMFIVSSQKQGDGFFKLYVNTKAPVIIDTKLQMAVQYVFTNNKYSVREALDYKKV